MADIKPGDRVRTDHECEGLRGFTVRHDLPVLVTSVDQCVVGTRYRGVRCDGSLIEWIGDGSEVAER